MRKLCTCVFITAAAMYAAGKPAAAKPAAPKQANRTARTAEVTIPPGAVQSDPSTWRYTDPQGRQWIYRKTPWGMARFEDKAGTPEEAAARQAELASMKAADDGEYVRFERPGPFGVYKWRQKKTELNDLEKQAWERDRNKAVPGDKQKQE